MLFYIVLYFIVILFAAVPQKRLVANISKASVLMIRPMLISMICICMYLGFRNQIGTDDAMYLEAFNQIAEYGTPWRNIEFSYVLICKIVQYLHGNIQLVFFIYAVVSCVLLNYIINRLIPESNRVIFVELFMSFLFLTSMVLMRQFAATCLFVVGYIKLKEGKRLNSIIILILAVFVHSSAVIGVVVLSVLPWVKKLSGSAKSLILILLFIYQYIPVADLVRNFISSTSLDNIYYISYYLGSNTGYRTYSNPLGIVNILYLMLFIYMLLHKHSLNRVMNDGLENSTTVLQDLEAFSFVYFSFSMFFAQFGYVTRVAYFFSFFMIAYLSGFGKHISVNSKKLFGLVCCIVFFGLYVYSVNTFATENNTIIPYLYNFTLFSK
ncbi:EpsG family protein [Enterococcus faecium]|uniref:EpsG family protein n=1 Tax=Enterococcus faecium TaxID=1352 RepID=UPI003CC64832